MATKPRVHEFDVTVDAARVAHSSLGGSPFPREAAWWAEHLVLAGLVRCTLTSLRYHCVRANVRLTATASARGTVTRREDDGRFAFVDVVFEADVAFEPKPDETAVAELLAKGERDCFVGASLTAKPSYTWRVR